MGDAISTTNLGQAIRVKVRSSTTIWFVKNANLNVEKGKAMNGLKQTICQIPGLFAVKI
jgi:hypothetical protein